MALQVERTGRLEECAPTRQVGDIIPKHGRIMRIETIAVQDFILFTLSGGLPLHGFDQIVIDERFVTSASSNEDGEDVVEGGAESNIESAVFAVEEDEVIGEEVEDGDEESVEDDGLPCVVGGEVVVYWIKKL